MGEGFPAGVNQRRAPNRARRPRRRRSSGELRALLLCIAPARLVALVVTPMRKTPGYEPI